MASRLHGALLRHTPCSDLGTTSLCYEHLYSLSSESIHSFHTNLVCFLNILQLLAKHTNCLVVVLALVNGRLLS